MNICWTGVTPAGSAKVAAVAAALWNNKNKGEIASAHEPNETADFTVHGRADWNATEAPCGTRNNLLKYHRKLQVWLFASPRELTLKNLTRTYTQFKLSQPWPNRMFFRNACTSSHAVPQIRPPFHDCHPSTFWHPISCFSNNILKVNVKPFFLHFVHFYQNQHVPLQNNLKNSFVSVTGNSSKMPHYLQMTQ